MNNFNAITNSFYSVANQSHLEVHKEAFGLASDEWAGFKQWNEQGRKVSKGAKGCKVFMVCDKKIEAETSEGEEVKKQVLKALYVFNKEHTETI